MPTVSLKDPFRICGIVLLLFAAVSCGKKETVPPAVASESTAAASDAKGAAPAPPAPGKVDSPASSEAEAIITQRTIDYAKGVIARKQYRQAREAIQQLETRPLTPDQRKAVDELKVQIPPG